MAGTHRGLSLNPELANHQSELSIIRDQHSRNARNADYKAMLNARIAVKRTVEYLSASEQERDRMLKASMAEAAARRLQNRQDHDSKMADFDNGIRHKRTNVPIKAFLESTAAANRNSQTQASTMLIKSTGQNSFIPPTTPMGKLAYPMPSTAPNTIFRSIETIPRGPGMATAPPEPIRALGFAHAPLTRSMARRTGASTGVSRPAGGTTLIANIFQGPRISASSISVSPHSKNLVTQEKPDVVTKSKKQDSPPASLNKHGETVVAVCIDPPIKRKSLDKDENAPNSNKRCRPSMETQFEALRNVVQNLSGEMSQQRNNIEALQQHSSQPREGRSGSPVAVYQSSSFNAQVQNLNQLAKAQHEAALTIIQLTYPRMAAALDRLNVATEAILARVQASGTAKEEITAETEEVRSAMDYVLDLLDGQNRVG